MSLVEEYRKQYAWRDWTNALLRCPISSGQKVLDLGCGPGDISAELAKRGALVTGIDGNSELLEAAKVRCPQGEFEKQDLNSLDLPPRSFDGLWCSFTAAYFTDFNSTFSKWEKCLKNKAWVCVTDIDDLLGHEPLSELTNKNIEKFYEEAFSKGRYDFKAGRKIESVLMANGFSVTTVVLADQELSFNGPASAQVKQAWVDRFDRMGGLKSFFNEKFTPFQEEFIRTITSENHHSRCKVISCIGIRE